MKLSLSQTDRAAMAALFMRPSSRGGSPEILLAQDDLHTLFSMDDFMALETLSMSDLSTDAVEYDIPDTAVPVLRVMLGWPGQQPNAAKIVATVLRRM